MHIARQADSRQPLLLLWSASLVSLLPLASCYIRRREEGDKE